MSVDERSRHELYVGLEEVLGRARADTMMALLPPVGWADVATKQDLAMLRTELEGVRTALSAKIETEIHGLRAEMERQTRQIVLALVPLLVAVIGIVFAIGAAFG